MGKSGAEQADFAGRSRQRPSHGRKVERRSGSRRRVLGSARIPREHHHWRADHAKHAAVAIDAYLAGAAVERPPHRDLATADRLNTWYYSDAPKTVRPRLDAARRTSTFDEVVGGLDETTAVFEARRCLSCGNCFGCDNCFGVCPDNAVLKVDVGHGYRFDYDYCKGCGLCVQECPCGASDMVPEDI